jgi:hypothetical protein
LRAIIRCGVPVIGLFIAAAGVAAENTAVSPKNAIDALLTQLNSISHDRDMTTAKKAIVTAEALEKFNQQYKGKLLTVRLKIQDVVPNDQGHYLTANRPDLGGVQSYTAKFQTDLSDAEVKSVTKDSILVVTGLVSATNQPQSHIRSSDILKPGSSIAFPLRANQACQICLDNVSFQLEAVSKTRPDAWPARASGGNNLADKLKNEQLRSVDDVKLFFLKGVLQTQHHYGNTNTSANGKAGTGQSPSSTIRPSSGYSSDSGSGSGSAKVKHNRIYTSTEIIQKFGNPSSRTSKAISEEWVYKCQDGVVHVHFTQVGYARSSSTSKSESLRLEVKSVDSSSSSSAGNSRF